jgi:hypothetical protein
MAWRGCRELQLTEDDLRDSAQDAELGRALGMLRGRLLGCLVTLLGMNGEG